MRGEAPGIAIGPFAEREVHLAVGMLVVAELEVHGNLFDVREFR
jgi:hypothetical protein